MKKITLLIIGFLIFLTVVFSFSTINKALEEIGLNSPETDDKCMLMSRTGTYEDYDCPNLKERRFKEAFIEDQTEKGVYHLFRNVTLMSYDEKTEYVRFDLTNYYIDKEKSEETYYYILKPYIILNDSETKLSYKEVIEKYPTIKTKLNIFQRNNKYEFYPELEGIPVYNTSYLVSKEKHYSYHSPLNFIGYDLIETNMKFKVENDNWIFDGVDLSLDTNDLKQAGFSIEVTDNEIKINVTIHVNAKGELKADPSVTLSSVYGAYVIYDIDSYSRNSAFGRAGCGPTPTPGPP